MGFRLRAAGFGPVARVGALLIAFVAPFAPLAPLAPFAPLAPLYAQSLPPELTRPVNDFANVIDRDSEAEIERRILALKQASGDVVVVATIGTFAPYADIREYAVRMFENHGRGIGDKGKDNGLLVLLAVNDRRVWVEVGYDLEQFITDGFAGEVSRTAMTPYFARGEYGGGLLDGVTRIITRVAQGRGVTLTGVPQAAPGRGSNIRFGPWLILAIIIIVLLMNRGGGRGSGIRRGRNQWGGGSWSGPSPPGRRPRNRRRNSWASRAWPCWTRRQRTGKARARRAGCA